MAFANEADYLAWREKVKAERMERRLNRIARACLVKRRYKNIAEAKVGAYHQWKRRGVEMYGYECRNCGGYHLTREEGHVVHNIKLLSETARKAAEERQEYDRSKARESRKQRAKRKREMRF